MANPVWGLLQKAQDDAETIEEAIARLIEAHNDNPDAHTEAGQSLEAHKSSETIDHLAESIVNDKIGEGEVSTPKLDLDRQMILVSWESIDGWEFDGDYYTSIHVGELFFRVNGGASNYALAMNTLDEFPIDWSNKNPVFSTFLNFWSQTNYTAYFGIGDYTIDFIGFKVVDGSLYACWVDGGSESTQAISGITITDTNYYKVVMDSGTNIKFYVNGVLKHTATSGLPSGTLEYIFDFYIETSDEDNKFMIIGSSLFYQDV